jgi:hypothetical protein
MAYWMNVITNFLSRGIVDDSDDCSNSIYK